MKLLAFSDSHGYNKLMGDIINIFRDEAEAVLFMGDCVDDFADFQYIFPKKQFLYVIGNCDMNYSEPAGRLVDMAGKKIFMTHGDRFGVKSGHKKILQEVKKLGADICLHGHSHEPAIFSDGGVYIMSPGSISLPRSTKYPTFGIIDIENGKISLKIIEVSENGFSTYISLD